MKKVLLVLAVIILTGIIAVVLYLGYLGFIPGLATLFGSDKPRDLGVTWTSQDYATAIDKSQVQVLIETGEVATPAASVISTGSHPVQKMYSNSELSALITNNQDNWKYFPVSDVQVKISDGSGQVSGILHLSRLAGYAEATGASSGDIKTVTDKFSLLPESVPFYIDGAVSVTNKQVSFNVAKAELGRASVPNDYFSKYAGGINGFFTQQINAFPGFSINKLTLSQGQLNFDGTLADTIKTFK